MPLWRNEFLFSNGAQSHRLYSGLIQWTAVIQPIESRKNLQITNDAILRVFLRRTRPNQGGE